MAENELAAEPIHAMEITRRGHDVFYLFLDLFVDASGKKITAVSPHYGDDIDWSEHGVRLDHVVLVLGSLRIRGKYIPHRLDSWEPAILIDFEHESLPKLISSSEWLEVEVEAGPHVAAMRIATARAPAYTVALSVIIRNENRWIGHFLDYYLDCMDVDHVFVYDNHTRDQDQLLEILEPYRRAGTVTYIPWHYRWRNFEDKKQIGQPPQQSHSLGRFGNSTWIGFFDVDEFLRIPGKTLPEFLADHDPAEIDGLSFGLRWFFHRGTRRFEEIENPLFEMLHCRRDELGRKRQKLVVSPRDVRFMRFHWLEEGKRERQIDDSEIFFHHYYNRLARFDEGLLETDATYDPYMLRFAGRVSGQPRPEAQAQPLRSRPTSTPEWIAHVERAFELAESGKSRLPSDVHQVEGMCGRKNRIFLNELCGFESCRYLEVGSHAGASLCAAISGNPISAVAIENWSEFGGPRETFFENVSRFQGSAAVEVIEEDCFKVDLDGYPAFDIFYYDGHHSFESHYQALRTFSQTLGETGVVVIDDWNWPRVRHGTRKAIDDLGLKIAFQKEIILPEEDVEDMPRHRGASGWWNGVCVLVIERQSEHERSHITLRDPVEVVVFSKDRACQLEALLRSMDEHFIRPHRRHVLYTASEPNFEAGYNELKRDYPGVDWVREQDFRADLLGLMRGAAERSKFLMFLVDDIVWTRSFDGQWACELLEDDPDVLAVCLRLGENVRYCHPRNAATVPPDLSQDLRWVWKTANPGYWNYPMSVDGNLFRSRDLLDYLPTIPFHNPNTFEANMARNPLQRPLLATEPEPYLVNLALNRVQETFQNPCGDVSAEWMNQQFLDGARIDIAAIGMLESDSCHIEPEIGLIEQRPTVVVGATANVDHGGSQSREIDLHQIPIFVVHCDDDTERQRFIEEQFAAYDLNFEFVAGTRTVPSHIGQNLSHLRVLDRDDIATPFLLLEDDCQFAATFETTIRVAKDADAVYLGTSMFGIDRPGVPSWGVWRGVEWSDANAKQVRVYNMLSRHAILFLSNDFRRAARNAALDAMIDLEHSYPGDIGYAVAQESHRVYAQIDPLFYQSERFSPSHVATRASLRALDPRQAES